MRTNLKGQSPDGGTNHHASDDLREVIEVFARGFAFTRSFTRPYLASKVGQAWWLRDDPERRNRRRNDEWIAPGGVDPEKLDRWARERAAGKFLISAVASDAKEEAALREKFRDLGYRLWRTEPFMSRSTSRIPPFEAAANVWLVDSEAMATRLATAARGRMIPPGHLGSRSSPVRCHVVTVGDRLAGWVQSVSVGGAGWCASVFVEPEYRRRGFGRALVEAMLRADRAAGLSQSILVARHAGAKLYASVGYETVGTVLVYTPAS